MMKAGETFVFPSPSLSLSCSSENLLTSQTFLWFKAAVFHFFFTTSDQFSFPVCSEDSSCYGRPTVVLLSSNWSAPKCCQGIEPHLLTCCLRGCWCRSWLTGPHPHLALCFFPPEQEEGFVCRMLKHLSIHRGNKLAALHAAGSSAAEVMFL